jgi:hypothetical protein
MTTQQAGIPATTKTKSPATVADDKARKLIVILKEDHNFDIISKILDHIGLIERAKKIKPIEKHRLLQNYYLTMLTYCVPKMKIVEDDTNKNGTPINFQINIGGTPTKDPKAKKPVKGGVSITIPTKKGKDGSYSVSQD